MKGFTDEEYVVLVKEVSWLVDFDFKNFKKLVPKLFEGWLYGYDITRYFSKLDKFLTTPVEQLDWSLVSRLVSAGQLGPVIKAFRSARSHNLGELFNLKSQIVGNWKSSSGSGTMTYSSVIQNSYTFRTDYTFLYRSEYSMSTYIPPVGGSPYPLASAGSARTSSEQGLFIISSPEEMLLISDKDRNTFVRVKREGDVLDLGPTSYTRQW